MPFRFSFFSSSFASYGFIHRYQTVCVSVLCSTSISIPVMFLRILLSTLMPKAHFLRVYLSFSSQHQVSLRGGSPFPMGCRTTKTPRETTTLTSPHPHNDCILAACRVRQSRSAVSWQSESQSRTFRNHDGARKITTDPEKLRLSTHKSAVLIYQCACLFPTQRFLLCTPLGGLSLSCHASFSFPILIPVSFHI